MTPTCCSTGPVKVRTHSNVPVHLLVIYFLGNVGHEGPVNLLGILILSGVDKAVIFKHRAINTQNCQQQSTPETSSQQEPAIESSTQEG